MRCLIICSLTILIFSRLGAQQPLLSLADSTEVSPGEMSAAAPPIMLESWNQAKTKFLEVNFGFALLLDHNTVIQDDVNVAQVGEVDPATEFRGDRFILSGSISINKKAPWRYMVSANFNGLDAQDGKKRFDFIDWNLEIPLGQKGGWFTVGKQKEGVGHEYVAPGTQLMFMERGSGVPMWVRQRNIGLRYSNSLLAQRITCSVGAFNDYWASGKSFSANGSQLTARVTGLPVYASNRHLVHFGVGYRSTQASEDKLAFKARPEANSAPHFINTGAITADGACSFMAELIGVRGPVSVIAEYMHMTVKSPIGNSPQFNYWQVGGSWFLTGENRRYNRLTGNLGKVIPTRPFTFKEKSGPGAIELAARYTHTDTGSELADGGILGRFTGAVSWYMNSHFRLSVNYGLGKLEKNEATGKAQFWQFRLQFEI